MEKRLKIEVSYHEGQDTLYLRTIPKRPARMAETDYDFYIRYDWDDPTKIVGFEWLDFSTYFNTIDDPDVIPELEMRFDIVGTNVEGVTLKEILRWAYQKYVLKKEPLIPSLAEQISA
ncbi:MAG: hypothetical protein ACE5MB_08925 [Anaerolineae bacterium]